MKEDNWTIVGTVGTGDGSSPLCEERIIDLQLLKLESNMLLMLGKIKGSAGGIYILLSYKYRK